MARTKLYAHNAVLNNPGHHSTAAIAVKLESSFRDAPYGSVQISDCDRKIELLIDSGNPEEFANSVHKLDVLLVTLTALQRALIMNTPNWDKKPVFAEVGEPLEDDEPF